MARISKAQKGKKIKIGEDSKDYVTKIRTDDKGDISSMKVRRTLKGFLTGAPRAKKIMKSGGKSPAWQRKEGKSPSGGLNAKGRASLKAAGHNIKPPQPGGGPRKKSFCARMSGMKKKLTSAKTANDPNSRINKSLRKWKC